MSMQNRPDLFQLYNLNRRFTGNFRFGSRDVWVYSGNYLNFNGGRNNRHRHSYYEVCLVLDGHGRFDCSGKSFRLSRGDLFTADLGVMHEIISETEQPLEIQFISFSFSEPQQSAGKADELYDECIDSFIKEHAVIAAGADELALRFRCLAELNAEENNLKWYLQCEGIIRQLILDIIFHTATPEKIRQISLSLDIRLDSALRYICDNPERNLTVEEIAAHANTSPRTLRRLFKNEWGVTVVEKCAELRIGAAGRRLLGHPDESIAETAYRFGFSNPSDFGRLFKKVTGISPGEFRERRGTVFF